MAKLKDITPTQYAVYRDCTLSNVTKHLRAGNIDYFTGVEKIENYSRFYIFKVKESMEILPLDQCIKILAKKRKAKTN